MSFRITGLPVETFAPLFGLPEDALAARGVMRRVADERPGFPCRITMQDAEPGETLLLLNYEHQTAPSPYRSSHAIFVRENATERYDAANRIPPVMRSRLLSVRAFSADHMMLEAEVAEGRDLEPLIERFLARPQVSYLHAHNARQGCFSGRIDRAA